MVWMLKAAETRAFRGAKTQVTLSSMILTFSFTNQLRTAPSDSFRGFLFVNEGPLQVWGAKLRSFVTYQEQG